MNNSILYEYLIWIFIFHILETKMFTNWLIYSHYHCYIGNKPILTSLRNSIWRASHGNITQLIKDIIQGMKRWKWENNFFIWIDSNHKTWINCWIQNTFNQTCGLRLFHSKMLVPRRYQTLNKTNIWSE